MKLKHIVDDKDIYIKSIALFGKVLATTGCHNLKFECDRNAKNCATALFFIVS